MALRIRVAVLVNVVTCAPVSFLPDCALTRAMKSRRPEHAAVLSPACMAALTLASLFVRAIPGYDARDCGLQAGELVECTADSDHETGGGCTGGRVSGNVGDGGVADRERRARRETGGAGYTDAGAVVGRGRCRIADCCASG